MNVVVLSGGVGGARFVPRRRRRRRRGRDETVIGNVGDDVEVLGLHVSPDLDSILYALAGLTDEQRGWGRARRDVAGARDRARARRRDVVRARRPRSRAPSRAHAGAARGRARSRPSRRGSRARSASRRGCCRRPTTRCAPGSTTPAGSFPFQEWFVARGHRDEVDARPLRGRRTRRGPRRGCSRRSPAADLILLAPSNPYVSIAPILAVRELRDALARRRVPCVAVSPLIGGRAVKGPADRMLQRLAGGTSPAARRGLLPGTDRRARGGRGRRGRPRRPRRRPADRDPDAHERRRRAPPPRRGRARSGARVRVAIVGGTGDFGLALARRLVEAGDEVVIGSRDAERAQEKANEVGAAGGAANEDAVARRRPRRARDEGRCGARHRSCPRGRDRRDARAQRRERSSLDRRELSRRRADAGPPRAARSSPGSTRSPPASSRTAAPTRTPSSAATTPTRRRSRSSSRRRSSPAARSTPGRWRALAPSRG